MKLLRVSGRSSDQRRPGVPPNAPAGVRGGAGAPTRAREHVTHDSLESDGHMDKVEKENRWGWLPAQMPGVTRLIREKRVQLGDAHVNECWRRGVLEREPGWFFAREGALAIGTPWEDAEMVNFAAARVTSTQALVCMRSLGGTDGTR